MFMLFFILLLISIVALIIGLIKPDLILRFIDEEKRTRKNVLKIIGIVAIASFVLMFVTVPDTNDNIVAENEVIEEEIIIELSDEEKELLTKDYSELEENEKETVNSIIKNIDDYDEESQDVINKNKQRIKEGKLAYDEEQDKIKAEEERIAQEKIDAKEKETIKKDDTKDKEEFENETCMISLEHLYKKVNDEYENQKDNFNPTTWAEFGRNFRDESDELDVLDKNQENMDYNLALGDIKQLHLEYNKILQGRDGDPEYFKNEIDELLK